MWKNLFMFWYSGHVEKKKVNFSKIPDSPGIYLFRKGKRVLYVGKATSLRDRIKSYFASDIAEERSPLVAKIVEDASKITWEETDSVLDALILEAKRIKELKPVGNTDLKDDKSFNYVVVTKEKFPRVLTIRGRELVTKEINVPVRALFGPFPQGWALKAGLKIIRRIFPYFDTPFPIIGHRMSNNQEKTIRFNQTIGLYPKELNAKEYAKTIRHITLLFQAKKSLLLKTLEKEMNRAAKEEQFEDAAELRRQLFALQHIQDVTLIKEDYKKPEFAFGTRNTPSPTGDFRIEAYDTAHTRGSEP